MVIVIEKDITKTAEEMEKIINIAKRKLIEFEVLMSVNEINSGKCEYYNDAKKLMNSLK